MAALALAACGDQYPNSTFTHLTDLNTATDALWNRLLLFGTVVFVFVEVLLLVTIFKFRQRPGSPAPKQVHGNAVLEITWTAIPALILVMIAIPTVKTIFKTQAKAATGSLQVEVIGHQWWWEFRYPELGVTTANELYIPAGRTVNFALKTKDVLHS
ncbi:MAG: cytochrome c oxidase subunit II, partial [Betaproteobacteria bacterium]|nr:cytochrome c oxidase subunit II [Betaproteobacteria bacterium]